MAKNIDDYDTHEAYAGPLRNSTEKLYNKAQKAAEKDNWAAYKAGKVPGASDFGDRVGAFYGGIDWMKSSQPDLDQLIQMGGDKDA